MNERMPDKSTNHTTGPVILSFETPAEWEAWLAKNHASSKGVFIRIGKKGSGIPSITAPEALEVALCHGWIDAIRKAGDERTFLQHYTPRGPRSIWSEINKKKVQELMKAKLLRPAGLAAVERAKANGQWANAYAPASTITVPPDLEAALHGNRKARDFFATLKGSNRFAFLHRLATTKKPETRAKRLETFVGMMERGEIFHPGPKTPAATVQPDRKPAGTQEYLARLPTEQRKALAKLRDQVLAAAPGAVEHFGYGLPGFKYNGHPLLYIGAAKEHCAIYGAVPKGLMEALKDFKTSKGTVQFTPGKPLPAALVKAIVKAKCMEIEARWPKKDQTIRKSDGQTISRSDK